MTVNCDSFVFSSIAPIEKLKALKKGGSLILICSSECELFVYSVSGTETGRQSCFREKLCERWKFDSPVVEIIRNEKIYIILKSGGIWRLDSSESSCIDENDIFEMEDSPEIVYSWKLEEVHNLFGCSAVISASISKIGICILAQVNSLLQVFVINDEVKTSSTLLEGYRCGCTCVVNISSLSFDFMNLWLPHVERSNEFLFVGLNDGSVFCYPLSLALKSYCIYRSVHSIVTLNWFEDRQSDRFDSLVIVLDSGAVIRLTPVGEEVSFPFLPFLSSAVSLENCILSRDENETRFLMLGDVSNVSKIFPISDVVGGCSISDNSKMLFVSDKNSFVHFINSENVQTVKTSSLMKEPCGLLPRVSDLLKLISSSEQLTKINQTVKLHDEYLRAKSLVARADILKEHFSVSIKLVQMLGNNHTMRFNISFNLPGIVFPKDFWKLDVTVCTMTCSNTYRNNLLNNLSSDRNLIQLFTIPISFDLLYNFECKLVYCIESKNIELFLPLGKVEINAGHFLFPLSAKELSPNDLITDALWTNDFKYCLSLSIEEKPSDSSVLLTALVSDSKALWRKNEWKKMLRSESISSVLFGYDVEFRIQENLIVIESLNLKACVAVRLALSIKLKKQSDQCKEQLAQFLLNWCQIENIIKLSDNPQDHIANFYNILKNINCLS